MSNLFKYQAKNSLPNSGKITAQSPSNIALVKYWGKKDIQIPTNPSISFTLENCHTKTSLEFKKSSDFKVNLFVEGNEKPSFIPKIEQFLNRIKPYCPYIFEYELNINTQNTFPHSSGIASSASGFSALSMCIVQLEKSLTDFDERLKLQKASFLSRLGSGSASRSIYGPMAIWGNNDQINDSNDQYAISHSDIHPVFKDYQDTILLVDKGAKQVSSSVGHQLMHNHPYASQRFSQANNHIEKMIKILKKGDLEEFISITELEALTLHAMMMTSNPYFILMKEGTLSIINKIWEFRNASNTPLSFTLDAGANVHLLYPSSYKQNVLDFIESELVVFCENQQYICDVVGQGAKILKEIYA
ncbi:MAG: diphosphomevalonate decarboxylase [Crocinitomicaceae bacterium]|nr:diphosphomevalonate decarboxylase [Crocinitomicaceae bacterium]